MSLLIILLLNDSLGWFCHLGLLLEMHEVAASNEYQWTFLGPGNSSRLIRQIITM
jgi:hypothetical protein